MLKLDELATKAGVSPRTVRYYIQRGVLPPPNFKGPDTSYDDRHLHTLKAIKRLQEDYLPLDEIAAALHGKSDAELKKIAERGVAAKAAKPEPARAVESKRGERIMIAKGIELWVEDDADRALVEQILSLKRGQS
jgi:DNA-binding transcriptional MerR regulator